MEKSVLQVEGMSCEHCVRAVNNAVGALAGVSSVAVDLAAKTVTVEHEPTLCPLDNIKKAIAEEGYDVVIV